MKTMTVSRAAAICGGRLTQYSDAPIGRAIIDSRQVQPGDMFVAYRGENVDGHRFIAKALEAGAALRNICRRTYRGRSYWRTTFRRRLRKYAPSTGGSSAYR